MLDPHSATVAAAGFSVIAGYVGAGVLVRFAVAAAKQIVRITRTSKDDRFVQKVEHWINDNPEAIVLLERIVEAAKGIR